MKLNIGEISEIYVRSMGTITIIPTDIPLDNVKALNVSSCNQQERQIIKNMCSEYQNYLNEHISKAFNFEEWIEQSYPSFDVNNVKWIKINKTDLV